MPLFRARPRIILYEKGGEHMNETPIVEETQIPYEKPAISSYTEAELLESMEVWGASGTAY